MNLRKWRYVEYSGDEGSLYECLSCKSRFIAVGYPDHCYIYCPMCGIKWEGKHECRPHNYERWKQERFGPNYIDDQLETSTQYQYRQNNRLVWRIVKKFVYDSSLKSITTPKWEYYGDYGYYLNSSKEILSRLKGLRALEDKDTGFGYWEYSIRLCKAGENK